jgi:peptide/nickel transport system substrate-binding protein
VVIALGSEPPCLNAFIGTTCQSSGFTLDLFLWQVLEGAFEVGPSLDYRPNLISGATVTREPFTVTYHIRPEARWSDGVPVSASDFVFTFQTLVDPSVNHVLQPIYAKIRRVRALDAKTFRVVFHEQVAAWRDLFSALLPRHALAGEDFRTVWREDVDNLRTGRPIGSGPFLLQSFERGRQVTLVRNPRYWGPHRAYLDRIVFRFVPPGDQETHIQALRDRSVDVIYPQVQDPVELASLRGEPGVDIASAPVLRFEHLAFQLRPSGHPALRLRSIRRALAYGIDRDAVVRRLFRTLNASLRPLDSFAFMGNSPHYRRNWGGYTSRPAEARRLLEAAGCRRGPDRIYVCAGERLSLRLATTAGNVLRERTAQILAGQLRQIGVEVLPVYASPGAFFGTILPEGGFDLALYTLFAAPEAGITAETFACDANVTGYCSGRVKRDLTEGERAIDPVRRAALLNRADRRLALDVPALPLYQRPSFLAYRSALRGVVENPSFDFFTWNSEDWWLARG